jgi:hypothetical protein
MQVEAQRILKTNFIPIAAKYGKADCFAILFG